jgi:hypothetical protein
MDNFPASPVLNQAYRAAGLTYYWNGTQWVLHPGGQGGGAPPADYVLRQGDTMGGMLTMASDPSMPLHAATKQYVDANKSGMPPGGIAGQALVTDANGAAVWGAPIEGGNFG